MAFERELGDKETANDFRKAMKDRIFRNYDDFLAQTEDAIMNKDFIDLQLKRTPKEVEARSVINQNIVSNKKTPSDNLKNTIVAISEGNIKQISNFAKKLNKKERKDVELILDEAYSNAEPKDKPAVKKEFEKIRKIIEEKSRI